MRACVVIFFVKKDDEVTAPHGKVKFLCVGTSAPKKKKGAKKERQESARESPAFLTLSNTMRNKTGILKRTMMRKLRVFICGVIIKCKEGQIHE